MHPVLIEIGPVPIHSYGFMLMLSFLFGIWLTAARASKYGIKKEHVTDLAFYIIIAVIIGARGYYVLLHYKEFIDNPGAIFNPLQNGKLVGIGGLVMLGGVILGAAAGFLFVYLKKIPSLIMADSAAPAIASGVFLTRIGCFLNGCCWGVHTKSFLGVSFPASCPAGAVSGGAPVFPTQLFSSFNGLLIFIILLWAEKRWKTFHGFTFLLFLMLYSIHRFFIDYIRYYPECETFFGMTHNQIILLLTFSVSLGLFLKLRKKEIQVPVQNNTPE
ncbi:MAG: prolipoprotein diacylglyceryl transferase [Fibrobacterota bacterium]